MPNVGPVLSPTFRSVAHPAAFMRGRAVASVLHAKVADQVDLVAVGVTDRAEPHALVGVDDLAWLEAHLAELANALLDVGDGQVEHPVTGPLGVLGHLDPATIGDLPLDQARHGG